MLTVNIKNWGSEKVLEALEIEVINLPQVTNESPSKELRITKPDNEVLILNSGVAYVMNFHGATVAKYELSDITRINGDANTTYTVSR